MRIIAGSARRTPLTAPKGTDTRPTADRVKENLFNILMPYIAGARFLDLFCGSGAIGIEALSRGAEEAVFVDTSRDAANTVSANLTRAKLTGRVLTMCALAAIPMLAREDKVFDIIFMDPPYSQGLTTQTLDALLKSPLLSPTGLVVAEIGADEEAPELGLTLQDIRAYGSARLLFYS
ncbi:MAG: 16S rRNA (guanine(966)-N(2))-methyltransferase RsmD [Defluviitaleaceae bacterium]|nr:16S rRNA (guanine(966)-N(2))-methyltransferase RsmD [Defluviitaleaceae bacterium]